MTNIITTDQRGRAPIGHPGQRYITTEDETGTITLEPAVVISELEHKFLSNLDLQARIAYMDAHPEEWIPRAGRRDR